MRRLVWLWVVMAWPGVVRGQSGFSADLLDFSPAAGGLLLARSPGMTAGRFEILLGGDWSHHLMGLERPGTTTLWIVEHRLSLRAAVAYTPTGSLRLSAGFTGVPLQKGLRTDRVGAQTPLRAGMGASWLSAVFAIPGLQGRRLEAAIATTLQLPTAAPAGLAGEQRLDVGVLVLLATRLGWFRPVLNLGLATRARTEFYDWVRDDGLVLRLGCEVGTAGWPVFPLLELAGETLLANPVSTGGSLAEGIIGLRIQIVAGIEVQLAAGFGLHGVGAPAVRGILTARWTGSAEKRDGTPE